MTLEEILVVLTALAVLAAAWAAIAASRSANAAIDLVEVERARDERAVDEERWHHARRVSVDAQIVASPAADGGKGFAVNVALDNAGDGQLTKCRLRVTFPNDAFGPMLIGNLRPTSTAHVALWWPDDAADDEGGLGVVVEVRFRDVAGRTWVANATGQLDPDEKPDQWWIDEGQAFYHRAMPMRDRFFYDVVGTMLSSSPL